MCFRIFIEGGLLCFPASGCFPGSRSGFVAWDIISFVVLILVILVVVLLVVVVAVVLMVFVLAILIIVAFVLVVVVVLVVFILVLVILMVVVVILVVVVLVVVLVLVVVVVLVVLVLVVVLVLPLILALVLVLILAFVISFPLAFVFSFTFLASLLVLLKATLTFTHSVRRITQVPKGLRNIKVPVRNTTDLTNPIIKIGGSIQRILGKRLSTFDGGIDLSTAGDSVDTNLSNRLETLDRHGTDDIVEFRKTFEHRLDEG